MRDAGAPSQPPAADTPAAAEAALTADRFLGGRFVLLQPKRGFRCGSDAILLAAGVPVDFSGQLVDLGCGPGAVGFAVATMCGAARVVLVDRDSAALALCRSSLARPENAHFADRISVCQGDISARLAGVQKCRPGTADIVLINPPWFRRETSRPSPNTVRAEARHQPATAGFEPWIRAARNLLAPKGRLGLIAPADALLEVLSALDGFGRITLYPLRASEAGAASRIIFAAAPGSRAPPSLLPGLVLHRDAGGYNDSAERILRDGARLPGLTLA